MSAICDAARNGQSVRGPYPKSYAKQLHSDSIQIEDKSDISKVVFQPFMGISPFRYRDLFEKGARKDKTGEAKKWKSEPRRPIIDSVVPSHLDAETVVISQLGIMITNKDAKKKRRRNLI
jgi:hypothetical protein